MIGTKTRYVDVAHAFEAIAGYTDVKDLSEWTFQLNNGGQWIKAKSCDSFAPIGPQLMTFRTPIHQTCPRT